jgi:flagellar biosynthesis protein FlhF
VRIKRYVAATMREVLAQVREEQGPDAVILSNRRAEGGGVELITAVDYDDALMDQAVRAVHGGADEGPMAEPAAVADGRGYDGVVAELHSPPGPAEFAGTSPAPEPPRVVWSQDPGLVAMRREVESLRELLEQQLAALAWNERVRREPVHARVLLELTKIGVAPDAARLMVDRMATVAADADPGRVALALLMKHLAVVDEAELARQRITTIVGSTGVGKTTTLIKLATRHAQKNGAKSVGFVSIAEERIGARDELAAFCRLIDAPLVRVETPRGLSAAFDQLKDRSLVLVDTPGVGPRDPRLEERLAILKSLSGRSQMLLALAANADQGALEELTTVLRPLRCSRVLLTKTDEAATLGGPLSVMIRHGLQLAYLSTGQGLIEDLHTAASRRIWIIKQAYALASRDAPLIPVDDNYMAEHFGRQAKHA